MRASCEAGAPPGRRCVLGVDSGRNQSRNNGAIVRALGGLRGLARPVAQADVRTTCPHRTGEWSTQHRAQTPHRYSNMFAHMPGRRDGTTSTAVLAARGSEGCGCVCRRAARHANTDARLSRPMCSFGRCMVLCQAHGIPDGRSACCPHVAIAGAQNTSACTSLMCPVGKRDVWTHPYLPVGFSVSPCFAYIGRIHNILRRFYVVSASVE